MVDMAFFRGGLGRWLPPSVPPVDEAVLLRRCWELLVLDRPGTARLAVLGRAPLCRTVLLPQENTAAPLRAQQVVVPVLAVGMMFVPFWFIRLTANHYKKNIAAELETALSIITTAYLRNEDIQTAVEENIDYLNPPVRSVFVEFLTRIKLVDPDVDAALQDMGTKIDNAVFREWVAALLTCRHDRGLKTILTPIVAKLSDMRIVNGELENLVFEPRKEFITMQVLVIGNIPLLYWLNQDWYDVLMHTPLGQALLAAIAAVMFISTAAVIKLTQPIEYRR